MSRLQTYYKETVVPQLKEKFSYANIMEIPKITKITLNMGVGEAASDKKVMGARRGRHDRDRGPEADCQQRTQVRGEFQDS